jgi:DNA excision repair protein ERCC-6
MQIKNPESQVTETAKMFHTSHRIILSGTPMQNNLSELWSVFDFVYPNKLGLKNDFMQQIAQPIIRGRYAQIHHMDTFCLIVTCGIVLNETHKSLQFR